MDDNMNKLSLDDLEQVSGGVVSVTSSTVAGKAPFRSKEEATNAVGVVPVGLADELTSGLGCPMGTPEADKVKRLRKSAD